MVFTDKLISFNKRQKFLMAILGVAIAQPSPTLTPPMLEFKKERKKERKSPS